MQLTAIISILALAGSALAAPAAEPIAAPVIEVRAEPLIDVWDGSGFLGLKFTGSADIGQCKNFPKDFNDNITSGKAKKGRCTIWVDKDCKGTGFSFNKDGEDKFPDWINNKASSWKCVK